MLLPFSSSPDPKLSTGREELILNHIVTFNSENHAACKAVEIVTSDGVDLAIRQTGDLPDIKRGS